MDFDRAIIRACDIRGTIPGQVSPDLACMIGNSLAGYLKPTSIAVGRDTHRSSAMLFDAITSGILDRGVDVIDLGPIPNDALCFAMGANGYDGGVMIAASPDASDTVTIRLYRRDAEPLLGAEIFDVIAEDITHDRAEKAGARGTTARKDIGAAYAEHVLSFVDPMAIRSYTLAVDGGAGMIGRMLSLVCERLLCTLIGGEKPAGSSGQFDDLKRFMMENNADFGVAFDDDTGRMHIIDGSGAPVDGDMITAMVADQLLTMSSSETIVYDVASSRAVPDLIRERGGTAVRSANGSVAIRSAMKKHNAVFGGDRSGNYYFRDNWYADSSLITLVLWLERLSRDDRDVADILKDLNPYIRSDTIIDAVADPTRAVDQLASAFSDGEVEKIDGLAVSHADWWFHARLSPAESKIRLIVEAKNEETLKDKVHNIHNVIRS